MSLINDALKHARQAQSQTPPSKPPPLAPVEPVSPGNGYWLAPVLIILLFAAAGIFFGLSVSKHAPSVPGTPLMAATMTQRVESAATALPGVAKAPPGSNTVAVVPPKPPEPKLQGILFAAARPCAIVSGKTVFVGDQINEFRVTVISQGSVTLQSGTVTKVLSLSPR